MSERLLITGAGCFIGAKGVNGRNSDNTLIQKVFNWKPATKLRDGLELTYRWIYDQTTKGSKANPKICTGISA